MKSLKYSDKLSEVGMSVYQRSIRLLSIHFRGVPRVANNILLFLRDYAQGNKKHLIEKSVVIAGAFLLGIDGKGLLLMTDVFGVFISI